MQWSTPSLILVLSVIGFRNPAQIRSGFDMASLSLSATRFPNPLSRFAPANGASTCRRIYTIHSSAEAAMSGIAGKDLGRNKQAWLDWFKSQGL
jgi:hypothetical protein